MPDPEFTAEQVDAAVEILSDPGRLKHAQEVVTHAAPGLQRVLNEALAAGGWFDEAHEGQVAGAALEIEEHARLARVRSLLADETRLGMLVGVAIGFELAHELQSNKED